MPTSYRPSPPRTVGSLSVCSFRKPRRSSGSRLRWPVGIRRVAAIDEVPNLFRGGQGECFGGERGAGGVVEA